MYGKKAGVRCLPHQQTLQVLPKSEKEVMIKFVDKINSRITLFFEPMKIF
jgi:hypothetical protein